MKRAPKGRHRAGRKIHVNDPTHTNKHRAPKGRLSNLAWGANPRVQEANLCETPN